MEFDVDSWFPNFTLFVLYLAPILMVTIFIIYFLRTWFRKRREPISWIELIGYIPIIYMAWPIWETAEYLYGIRSTIMDRLFGYHFSVMMFLIICVGIGQVCYYWVKGGK